MHHLRPAALVGYVQYPTQQLLSGVLPLNAISDLGDTWGGLNMTQYTCIPPAYLLSSGPPDPVKTVNVRGVGNVGSVWGL